MAPKEKKQRDIGWKHGEQIGDNRQHTQCNYCHKIMKGGGVSRLKQHLAGGYNCVETCDKCPEDIAKAMREHLNRNKKEHEEVATQRAQLRENLINPTRRRCGIELDSDESDNDMNAQERADIELAREMSIRDIHLAEQGYRGGRPRSSSHRGGGSSGLMRAHSVKEAWDKHSAKPHQSRKKGKGLSIEEMDPSVYRNREVTQSKLTHLWNPKKWAKSAKHAIGKFFIYENIPPNKAQGCFYQLMIDEIALAGVGVKGPTPYEIGGPILDDEIDELKDYIEQFKKKWDTYGVTIMCDGWTSITNLSIINFLVYCDGKILFHRSVNTSGNDKDSTYIFNLLDSIIFEIGEKYVVQVITDNHSAYKKAGEMLMATRPTITWTPCAAHSLDLILHDFAKLEKVEKVLEQGKRITNFIYNHNNVFHMMKRYCKSELIRPGQTRFATNYIALQSILEHKNGLQRMFTSEEWSSSGASRDPTGKRVHSTIIDHRFWENVKKVVDVHCPIARVLKMVDGEKQATLPYVYEAMRRAKLAIKEIAPKSCKKFLDIVDARWKKQIIQHIHMAAYYLNPEYHYQQNLGGQEVLLEALRTIVSRLEPNPTRASEALAEVKMFRDAMYGFADAAAIRGREKTEPAEWWFMYGTDAPNLRRIAMRILSQTASSSGCERNWSTFAMIHTKVRNRLNYEKLEKLVFAQYNMRLKLKDLMKDHRRVNMEYRPIDLTSVFEEDEGIAEWVDDVGDMLLDEINEDRSSRPNTFLATWAERYSDDAGGVGVGQSQSYAPQRRSIAEASGARPTSSRMDDDDFDRMMMGPRTRSNAVRVPSSDEDATEAPSNDNDGSEDGDSDPGGGADDGTGGGGGNVGGSSQGGRRMSQSPRGMLFTEEQGFTHATQDEDHGSRRMRTYERGHGRHSRPRGGRTTQGMDTIMRGIDLINTGLSSFSMSGGESYGEQSLSPYGHRSVYDSHTYGYGSGYDSQTYGIGSSSHGYESSSRGYGATSYGYGSGYDTQTSASHGYGGGYGQRGGWVAPISTQQYRCTTEEFDRFARDFEAYYRSYMSWSDYCQYVQRHFNVSLGHYPQPVPNYAPARHSTADWM